MLKFSFHGPSVLAVAVALMALSGTTPVRGQDAATAVHPDNYYAAAERIDITSPMGADVIVAARTVQVEQPVSGDIMAAGWHLRVTAPAHDDVRLAGGDITVDSSVDGDMTLAGGEITVGPATHVRGRAWMTGNTVRTNGIFEREVQIAAQTVQIGGELRLPVRVIAEKLEILPGARVLAPLTYKGTTEAVVAGDAVLSSPITFERIKPAEARGARSWPAASTLFFAVHLFVAGLLALYLVPKFEPSVVSTLRTQPMRSLVTGFVLLVTVPIAALMLVVSMFALPVGVALGMAYAMALFIGVLVTAFFVGDFEARLFKWAPASTRRQQGLLLLAGVLTLAVLRLVLGGVVVFLSVLFGGGALMLWLYDAYRHETKPEPVTA